MIEPFRKTLRRVFHHPGTAWVYLPLAGGWTLETDSAVLISEEVPPEFEDEPLAGYPAFAIAHDLERVISVASLQEVVANAVGQRPDISDDELFRAFEFYHDKDAFIAF